MNVGGVVTQIAVGGRHTCALLNTGNVRCWGDNGYGELGYGHTNTIGDDESPVSAGNVDVGGTVTQSVLAQKNSILDKLQPKVKLKYEGIRCFVNTVRGNIFSVLDVFQKNVQLFYLDKSGKRKYKAYASAKLLLNNILNANKYSLLPLSDQSTLLQRLLLGKPMRVIRPGLNGVPTEFAVIHMGREC